MKYMKSYFTRFSVIIVFSAFFFSLPFFQIISTFAFADNPVVFISGQECELSGNSHYEFSSTEALFSPTDSAEVMGSFTICGLAKENGDMNGVPCFTVKSGNLDLQYAVDNTRLNLDNNVWHVTDDFFARSVDDIKLNKKLGNGVLILQTSLDGDTWVTDVVENDISPFPGNNVVLLTKEHRSYNDTVPNTFYVLEEAHIDGIVIWQTVTGEVFQTQYRTVEVKLLYKSLFDYIEACK